MREQSNQFIRTKQSVSNADLKNVEKILGFKFPKEFRNHYLSVNGGRPERNLFKKDDVIYVVSEFLPIKFGTKDYLFEDVNLHLKIEREILPQDLIAFADDPGGDFYCFNKAGEIWIYRGDYSDDPDNAVTFLAKSLSEFIDGMFQDED